MSKKNGKIIFDAVRRGALTRVCSSPTYSFESAIEAVQKEKREPPPKKEMLIQDWSHAEIAMLLSNDLWATVLLDADQRAHFKACLTIARQQLDKIMFPTTQAVCLAQSLISGDNF